MHQDNLRAMMIAGFISSVVIGLGFYFDTRDLLIEFKKIKKHIKTSEHQLAQAQIIIQKNSIFIDKNPLKIQILTDEQFAEKTKNRIDLLEFISHAILFNHLQIELAEPLEPTRMQGMLVLPIHLILIGQLPAWRMFLLSMQQYPMLIALDDYNLAVDKNLHLKIDAKIYVFGVLYTHPKKTHCVLSESIQQMKQVGYIKIKHNLIGLVMTSHGELIELKPGFFVGNEKAYVSDVDENNIRVNVGDHEVKLEKDYMS